MIRQKSLRAKGRISSSVSAEQSKTEAPLNLAGEGRAYLKEVDYEMCYDRSSYNEYYEETHVYKREE